MYAFSIQFPYSKYAFTMLQPYFMYALTMLQLYCSHTDGMPLPCGAYWLEGYLF